jgi:Copper amine oxidase N-terminal domain
MFGSNGARVLSLTAALALSMTTAASAQGYRNTQTIALAQGAVLKAELNDRLSSTQARRGDRFTAAVLPSGYGLPSGTEVTGSVTDVREATQDQPGVVSVQFTGLRLPGGSVYPISGTLIDLNSADIRQTASGRLEARGRTSKNRTGAFLGYGAGAGALISALTGGSVLKGALLGALGGYAYQQLSRDKREHGRYSDVDLAPGTRFGVLMDRATRVNVAGRSYAGNDGRDNADSSHSRRDSRYRERTAGSFQQYRGDIRVMVDDREVDFSQAQPFMLNDHLMLPLEPVLSALGSGYRFDFDPRTRTATINGERRETQFTLGSRFAVIDGQQVEFDNAPREINGMIHVSAPLLAMATRVYPRWDANSRTLRIMAPANRGL